MALDPRPLEYDRSFQPLATRRQFRILILLVFLQLAVSVQSTYAPGVSAMVKQRWEEHKAAVARAEQVKQAAAAEQQCLQFTQPATKIVWEEDPTNAAKLLGGVGYDAVTPRTTLFSVYRNAIAPGAFARLSTPLQSLLPSSGPIGAQDAIIFLHARTSTRGVQRLVVAWFSGDLQLPDGVSNHDEREAFTLSLEKGQTFDAAAYIPGAGEKPLALTDGGYTEPALHPFSDRVEVPFRWTPSHSPDKPGNATLDRRDTLRVYAGQPDPADASHFTIDYTLDGQPGTIDGRLLDNDRVELKPRIGAVVGDRWYPRAGNATTRPATAH